MIQGRIGPGTSKVRPDVKDGGRASATQAPMGNSGTWAMAVQRRWRDYMLPCISTPKPRAAAEVIPSSLYGSSPGQRRSRRGFRGVRSGPWDLIVRSREETCVVGSAVDIVILYSARILVSFLFDRDRAESCIVTTPLGLS
jgi:hypothetical protein